jgi:CubicO group peptidase (beta-lactamase class C family)
MWGGAAGTFFWVDPKEELVAVFMSQGPFSTRASYRRLIKQLVYTAIVDEAPKAAQAAALAGR